MAVVFNGKMQHIYRPLCLTLLLLVGFSSPELNLPINLFEKWAQLMGKKITDICKKATGLTDLRSDYLVTDPQVQSVDGAEVIRDMKQKMEDMLQKKVEAVRRLVKVAEDAYAKHTDQKEFEEISYPKAKRLNLSEFLLEENPHFNNIPVNLSMSTVHVPTNVFDESAEVYNGVLWSEALDDTLRKNYEDDPTLTWQYFGSASGFFRNYPGAAWNNKEYLTEKIDIYDCRTRGWYIQAATSPKDIVMLVDSSGSMTGLRLEIAKATVEKILDTLSDDDFFNIIKFSAQPLYVDECFNNTLVQANADNKKRLKEALQNITTHDIAYFDRALTEAFELLRSVNDTGRGAQCNRAIMVITDGAPENYENIFKKYNWPDKDVRVFTYLIGREVGDQRQVKWMACANKGYFSHISTLADVHEHVQDYVHVFSRPMVIKRANHTVWTSVYDDAAEYVKTLSRPMVIAHPEYTVWTAVYMSADSEDISEGLQLMTSVAQPVFDTKSDTLYRGVLLGVVGTDVPLKELTKLTPQYKLGVNGYAFAITNNGYILFHPDFRPTEEISPGETVTKPNYNSVDLSEVELAHSTEEDVDNPTPDYNMELRIKMVDRSTDHLSMKVKVHYDNMKRVAIRENNYFFTDIEGTPFSLGIALPKGYGMNYLDGGLKLTKDTDFSDLRMGRVKIAPWNYCRMEANETRQDPVEMLLTYLEYGKKHPQIYNDRCDRELIESLVYDAKVTRTALVNWLKENRDGTLNDSTSRKNGVEVVFIGTKGGLTRYLPLVENLTDPEFIYNQNDTIEALYYKRAVEGGEGVFTFSIPFDVGDSRSVWWNQSVVTASSPIFITEKRTAMSDAADKEAVAAVVGLQMRYDKFMEVFHNVTKECPYKDCNLTCENPELECYILDNNGYVVYSEDSTETGKFFGEVDPLVMNELIIDEENVIQRAKTGVFQRVQMFDYQGTCEICKKRGSGASSIFVDPIRRLFSGMYWMIQEIALFLLQFNLLSWWSAEYTTVRGEGLTETDYRSQEHMDYEPLGYERHGMASDSEDCSPQTSETDIIAGEPDAQLRLQRMHGLLETFGSEQQVKEWTNELLLSVDYTNKEDLLEWYENLKNQYHYASTESGRRRPCTRGLFFYLANSEAFPQVGSHIPCCDNCTWSYSIHWIPETNLMFLAVDGGCCWCQDPNVKPILAEPVEVKYNETMQCQRFQTEIYRRRPSECYARHHLENSTACGTGCQLTPAARTLILTLLLIFLAIRH